MQGKQGRLMLDLLLLPLTVVFLPLLHFLFKYCVEYIIGEKQYRRIKHR